VKPFIIEQSQMNEPREMKDRLKRMLYTSNTPEHDKRSPKSDIHPEVLASFEYIEKLKECSADFWIGRSPLWYGWALREAFLAGISHARRYSL